MPADTLEVMDSGRWRAPAAQGPVRALLRLPGSKSITNRALVLAALSDRLRRAGQSGP